MAPACSSAEVSLLTNHKKQARWLFPGLLFGVALIGAALLYIRFLAFDFRPGTTTVQHPYKLFAALLMGAGVIWIAFIPLLKRLKETALPARLLWALLGLSLLYRSLFFGSVPIYEDDWNRYLWDGYMVTQGESPFAHSPKSIFTDTTNPDFEVLRAASEDGGDVLKKINNPALSTIYPPAAQGAFGLAALIDPFNLDALRLVFLLSEALTLFLLIKTLPLYGRSSRWVLLYAFCPLLIYSGFNAAHMDILLPPFLVGALWAVKQKPFAAGVLLAGAAAVKLWPLILAPALFRNWRNRPAIYMGVAVLVALLSAAAFWPMYMALGESSGLQAYAGGWERSSFIFPRFQNAITRFFDDPARAARYFVAFIVTAAALWAGFGSGKEKPFSIPARALFVTLALFFLSPTGFPWYLIWALPFLPFVPLYGVAVLCALVPLYYVRYALGEQNNYGFYLHTLIPLQFGLPLSILFIELGRKRISAVARYILRWI